MMRLDPFLTIVRVTLGSCLTRLVLEGCPLVTDRTMEVLKVKLYRLTHLNIKVS